MLNYESASTDANVALSDIDRLGSWRLGLFALPAIPAAAISFPIGAYLPPFYAEMLDTDLTTIGIVFFVARLWDIITDPLVGQFGDSTRTRWGARKPWMLAAFPILLLGIWLLFFPPAGGGVPLLLLALFVAYLGYTMLTITHFAWASDLSGTYEERSRLQGAILLASIAGLLLAMVFPAIAEGGQGSANVARVEALGYFALILLFPCIAVCLWSTPIEPQIQSLKSDFLAAFTRMGKRPEFRRILYADFAQGIAGGLLLSGFIFVAKFYLGVGERAALLLLIFMASGMIFVPAWIWIARKLTKHMTVALSSLATIPFILLLLSQRDGSFALIVLGFVGFGSTMGVWIFLTRSIVADLDEIEWRESGHRQTASVFALLTLTTKLGSALAVLVGFAIFDAIGFDPGATTIDADQALSLALLTFGAPIAGHLMVAYLLSKHPDDRKRLARLSAEPVLANS